MRRPLEQGGSRRSGGDQQHGFAEPGIDQLALDQFCKPEIELVFGNAARAHCAGHLGRMADVDEDAKRRTVAPGPAGRPSGGSASLLAASGLPGALPNQRDDGEGEELPAPNQSRSQCRYHGTGSSARP